MAGLNHPMLPAINTFVEQVNAPVALAKQLDAIQPLFVKHYIKGTMNKNEIHVFNSLINKMNNCYTSRFVQQRKIFILATNGYEKNDYTFLSEATLKGAHTLKIFHIDMAKTYNMLSDNFKDVLGLKEAVQLYSDAVYNMYGDTKPKAPDCRKLFLLPIPEQSQPN